MSRAHPVKRPLLHALLLLALLLMASVEATATPGSPTRVACIGDSITFGSGLPDRERTSYPIVLGALLGPSYEVRNYGVSGATLLSNGDRPFIEQSAFQAVLEWRPDLVVVLLGTNDSKLHNWGAHAEEFESDYRLLVESLRVEAGASRVILCTPPPAWSAGESIYGGRIAAQVLPAVRRVASSTRCELIDLHTPFTNSKAWFPDGVHPNPHGVEAIARRVLESVELKIDPKLDMRLAFEQANVPFIEHNFHGFRELHFELQGTACRVVQPRASAAGGPWIWRARFWGHEPQFDRAMLERGWHVAYCDVGGLFGNDVAVERWNRLHELLTGLGLSAQPVLEGMSRGGLIAYNWARANPTRVAGIYGDNPVCDARSWPGGAGASTRRATEWSACLAAYGLDEQQAARTTAFPVDGLEPLAKAGVPLLHVIGEQDSVVPVAENSDVVEARYRKLGGSIEVLRKPGLDHHPHSLPDPQPIVDFALRATGRDFNPCTRAQPSVEWRGGPAGWGGGTWWEQRDRINALAAANPELQMVFLGDSITQSWTGSSDRLAHAEGSRAFDRWYGKRRAASFGLSGDRTEHLLYRIEHGNFDAIDPRLIVLMIGVNNINTGGDDGLATAAGIAAVVEALREHEPAAELLLLGCFPTKAAGSWARRQSDIVHTRIASLGEREHVHYRDLRGLFLQEDGALNPVTMRGDGIHITAAGYEAWASAIEPLVRELLGEAPLADDE